MSAISGMAVLFVGMLYAEQMPPLPEGAFSFAVIPDTQGYDGEGRTTKGGRSPGVGPTRNPKLDATVNWLLANRKKENIRFVTHTGDITDMNNDFQWRFCSNAMARLDGKLPYSVVPGNHDMKSNGDTTLFQRYFPASRYEQNSWYAGHFSGYTNSAGVFVSGDNANSCCLFENGDEKFVVLNIECNAPDPVLKWGGEMLSRYRDRHAIIATHQDIGAIKAKDKRKIYEETRSLSKKELAEYKPDLSILGRIEWKKCHGKNGNSGLEIWRKLSSRHPNVFLVVSGDQGMIKVTRVDERGEHGNMVYSLMQDTGGGFIRIFRFIPSEGVIRCYTIDPQRKGEIVHSYRIWNDTKWFNFTLKYPGVGEEKKASDVFKILSPHSGSVVPLIPSEYRRFHAKSREERRRIFADKVERKKIYDTFPVNAPLPVVFSWTGADDAVLSVKRKKDGKVFFKGDVKGGRKKLKNFEIATEYEWSVVARDGRSLNGTFTTEDAAPRLIEIKGVPNVRDLGGRIGHGGRRLRQGLLYRSSGLNNNADYRVPGSKTERLPKEQWRPGKPRLTPEAVAEVKSFFGFKTDVDLRNDAECFGMTCSPLGSDVRWIRVTSSDYGGLGRERGRCAFKRVFPVFLDEKNYPIVFHCIAGADRTGALACILNGLLGVDEEELYRDWEQTFLKGGNINATHREYFDKLISVFNAYKGATLNDRIAAYVISCGFTAADIERLRSIMLEQTSK